MKVIFTGHKILFLFVFVFVFFVLKHFKICSSIIFLFCFWWEVVFTCITIPLCVLGLFLANFTIFSLSLVFKSLTVVYLGMCTFDLFVFKFILCEVYRTSWIIIFEFFKTKFCGFLTNVAYFFLYCFCSPPLILL